MLSGNGLVYCHVKKPINASASIATAIMTGRHMVRQSVRSNENSNQFLGLTCVWMLAPFGRRQIADPFRMAHGFATRRWLSARIARPCWTERVSIRGHFPFLLATPREARVVAIVRVINQLYGVVLTCARGESNRTYAQESREDFSSMLTGSCQHKSQCLQVAPARLEPNWWG